MGGSGGCGIRRDGSRRFHELSFYERLIKTGDLLALYRLYPRITCRFGRWVRGGGGCLLPTIGNRFVRSRLLAFLIRRSTSRLAGRTYRGYELLRCLRSEHGMLLPNRIVTSFPSCFFPSSLGIPCWVLDIRIPEHGVIPSKSAT